MPPVSLPSLWLPKLFREGIFSYYVHIRKQRDTLVVVGTPRDYGIQLKNTVVIVSVF